MTRIAIVTLAILLACAPEAAAQSAEPAAPRLKELVAVSSEIVRIGDLVDNAGAAANVAVFRAPDLGQTGTVPAARVAEALRPHDVTRLETGGLSEVIVTRLSRAITGAEVGERIAGAFAGQFGFGQAQNLTITLDREVRILHVEPQVTGELAVARMNVEPRTGRFEIAFELPGSAAARRLPLRFTGTVTEMVESVTLTRALRRGDTVRESDVLMQRRPKAEVGDDAISIDQAVGLAAKRPLRANLALRAADLSRAEVVQRNEMVTMLYEVPGIVLTMRAKALEAGAVGDVIGVVNMQTNRTIQATVAGPGRVTLASTTPRVAAALAPTSDNPARSRTQ
jgi:flagella basal body P-ring formation protein FlgA